MKKLIFFDVTLVFEPSVKTWSSISELYTDLADFFRMHGLTSSTTDTNNTRRVLYIEPMDKMDKMMDAADKPPQKGLQKSLQTVMKKAENAGKEKK